MSKYRKLSVRKELVELLKSCQLPKEPISDTLNLLIDPMRVQTRQAEKRLAEERKEEEGK